jgi:hypothetical protein
VVIDIQGTDGEWHPFRLYADASADITLLRRGDCEMLGRELESGEMRHMGGIGSGLIRTFIHRVSLRLGTVEFPCRVAFADRQEVPRLLGRLDLFSRFKVCYDEVARVTEFHNSVSNIKFAKAPAKG